MFIDQPEPLNTLKSDSTRGANSTIRSRKSVLLFVIFCYADFHGVRSLLMIEGYLVD